MYKDSYKKKSFVCAFVLKPGDLLDYYQVFKVLLGGFSSDPVLRVELAAQSSLKENAFQPS